MPDIVRPPAAGRATRARDAQGKGRFLRRIDQGRIAPLVGDLGRHAETLRMGLGHGLDARLQRVAHLGRQGADADVQPRGLRHDVVGGARLKHAHGDHGRGQRIDATRHDGLQRHREAGCRRYRVDGRMRHGAVSALAGQRDDDLIGRCQRRALPEQQHALRNAGRVVHGEHRIARVFVEEAVRNHACGTAVGPPVLLGRLKDQGDDAFEGLVVRNARGGGHQHRRVTIVPARMHEANPLAGPSCRACFLDRQRIHVSPQANVPGAGAPSKLADNARAADPAFDGIAQCGQTLRNQRTRASFLEGEFRVAMQIAAQGHVLGNVDFGGKVCGAHGRARRCERRVTYIR